MYQLFTCNIIIIYARYIFMLDAVILLFLFKTELDPWTIFSTKKRKFITENHNICKIIMKCNQSNRSMLIIDVKR